MLTVEGVGSSPKAADVMTREATWAERFCWLGLDGGVDRAFLILLWLFVSLFLCIGLETFAGDSSPEP